MVTLPLPWGACPRFFFTLPQDFFQHHLNSKIIWLPLKPQIFFFCLFFSRSHSHIVASLLGYLQPNSKTTNIPGSKIWGLPMRMYNINVTTSGDMKNFLSSTLYIWIHPLLLMQQDYPLQSYSSNTAQAKSYLFDSSSSIRHPQITQIWL